MLNFFRLLFPRWRWRILLHYSAQGRTSFTGRLRRTLPDARQRRTVRGDRHRQRAVYSAGDYWLGILRQLPLLFTVIELLGALYLLWIGSLLIRSRPQTLTGADAQSTCPGFGKQLLLGLGSSLLNPKNALFYLALMTALLGPSVTLLQQTMSGIWMTSVVLFWDLLIVMFIGLPQIQRRLTRGILWIRAYRWRRVDHLRQCDRAAFSAERHFLISVTIFCK